MIFDIFGLVDSPGRGSHLVACWTCRFLSLFGPEIFGLSITTQLQMHKNFEAEWMFQIRCCHALCQCGFHIEVFTANSRVGQSTMPGNGCHLSFGRSTVASRNESLALLSLPLKVSGRWPTDSTAGTWNTHNAWINHRPFWPFFAYWSIVLLQFWPQGSNVAMYRELE